MRVSENFKDGEVKEKRPEKGGLLVKEPLTVDSDMYKKLGINTERANFARSHE